MTRTPFRMLFAILLTAAAGPGGSDRAADGYAVRLRIEPAAGGGVQRIDLPGAAIVALRNRDGSDVRVFDGRGRIVPVARTAPVSTVRRDTLTALPILGGRDTPVGARVSVRLDEEGRPRVAEVESADTATDDTLTLGALFDARRIGGRAERLDLAADIPAGQPTRFTVEASRDLDNWRTLGERVVYRTPGAPIAAVQLPLGAATLDRDYLRVTWRGTSRLIAPVTLRQAVLVSRGEDAKVVVPAKAPALVDDHAVEFVTLAAALVAIRVVPAADDGPIPIRILGRDAPELPWTMLARGIAAADAPALAIATSPRVIRVEADRGSAGFSAPPTLQLGFAPQALAFAASGRAPFVLAAGREGAADIFVPLDMLTRSDALAQARIADAAAPELVLAAPDGGAMIRLQAVLWIVLLAAVLLLGGLVWWAWKRSTPTR